ncbi:MAG: hypothetical protein WC124_01965 [Desulfoplanes sp.]
MATKTLAEADGTQFEARVYDLGSSEYASATVLEGGYKRISAEITRPADTTAYTAKDCIADVAQSSTTHKFANAARLTGLGGGIIHASIKTDKVDWTAAITMIIYDGAGPASFIADNAAFDRMWADRGKAIAVIEFPALQTVTGGAGSMAWANVDGINRAYTCSGTDLYFQLYTNGTPTPANGQKFYIELGVIRD